MRSEAGGARSKGETVLKEQREKKSQEVEASTLRLKIFVAAINRFPEQTTYEEIVEGAKSGKYKITYTVKKQKAK